MIIVLAAVPRSWARGASAPPVRGTEIAIRFAVQHEVLLSDEALAEMGADTRRRLARDLR